MQRVLVKIPRTTSKKLSIKRFDTSQLNSSQNSKKAKAEDVIYTHRFSFSAESKPIELDLSNIPKDVMPLDVAKEEIQKAYDNGFEDGQLSEIAAAKSEIKQYADWMKNIDKIISRFKNQTSDTVSEMENMILNLSVNIARHIIKSEAINNPETVVNRVKSIFNELESEKKLTIRLHPEAINILNSIESNLIKGNNKFEDIEVIEDRTLHLEDCIVEVPAGKIDARINTELEIILEELEDKFLKERAEQLNPDFKSINSETEQENNAGFEEDK